MSSADPTARDPVIDVPYLLALDTAVVRDPAGRFWAEASWAHDLAAHMRYLPRLTMFGVVIDGPPPAGFAELPALGTRFVASRRGYGRKRFYLALPGLLARLAREVARARVVHSTIAYGEGVPYGWFAFPLARLLRRTSVVTVEGSMWRLAAGERAGPKRRFEAWASERINRWCVAHVDYVAFQHEQYRATLPAPRANGGVLFQASWINEADVIGEAELAAALAARAARPVPRALFATRLLPQKGTRVLGAAIELLAARGVDLDLDVMGAGEEEAYLAGFAGRRLGRGQVRVLPPRPYGPDFLAMLGGYDLLVSPNLADEQPRIVYDAGARGVPAVVSDAPGVLSCVEPGVTAAVVPRGDAAALADALAELAPARDRLAAMGRAARVLALGRTHRQMHDQRRDGILHALARAGTRRI